MKRKYDNTCTITSSIYGQYDENCECITTNTNITEQSCNKKLLYSFDLIGQQNSQPKLKIEIYNNGTVEKKYIIE